MSAKKYNIDCISHSTHFIHTRISRTVGGQKIESGTNNATSLQVIVTLKWEWHTKKRLNWNELNLGYGSVGNPWWRINSASEFIFKFHKKYFRLQTKLPFASLIVLSVPFLLAIAKGIGVPCVLKFTFFLATLSFLFFKLSTKRKRWREWGWKRKSGRDL